MTWLSAFNLMLLALCGGLGWLAYDRYTTPPEELSLDEAAAAVAPASGAAPSFKAFRMPPQQSFTELVERPPFTQSRRPPTVAVRTAAKVEAPRRDLKLTLIGVILHANKQVALVQKPGRKEVLRLARGEKVDGWQVEGILPDRVVLSQSSDVVELELKDAKIKRPKVRRNAPRTKQAQARDSTRTTKKKPALRQGSAAAEEAEAEELEQGERPDEQPVLEQLDRPRTK